MAARNEWDTDEFGEATSADPWAAAAASGGTPTAPSPEPGPESWSTPSPQTSAAPAAAPTDTYDSHLSNIASATNPGQQAAAQDDLARQLQTDLEADGHGVKWTGATTLSIDGRDYELGTGGGQSATDPSTRAAGTPDPNSPEELARLTGIYGPGGTAMSQPSAGATWNPATEGWNPAPPATGGGGQMDDNAILAQIAKWAAMPGADPTLANDPQYYLRRIKETGGLGPANLQWWQDASVGPTAFFNNPDREKGAAGGGAGQTSPWLQTAPGARRDPTYPDWSPSAPVYSPDFIDDSASELPGFNDILGILNTPGAGDAELEKLVQSIVEHPETLTDEDIARLKAQSAEEAAVAGQSQDEELQHFGFNAGLDSSPWLAGQRATNAWNRSNSTITANRGIDIAAASQRQADRQQAASIGTAYSSFQSSKKAQAVGLAVTAALGKAGEQRSRKQLNESLKQAATQLGLTKDNLVMTYISHVMTDITNNKQIDLNFEVDMKKLAEQSDEFKQTLLQKMHELAQQDDQFKANYGLAAQEFQHRKDTDAWDRAKSTTA